MVGSNVELNITGDMLFRFLSTFTVVDHLRLYLPSYLAGIALLRPGLTSRFAIPYNDITASPLAVL